MIVLGVDVAKAKLDAAVWLPVSKKWYACKVDNDLLGCRKLLAWAQAKSGVGADAIRVVMEATGVYHELARYGEQGDAQDWQPPASEIRALRALLARLAAVGEDLQREQNRLEKAQIAQTPELVRDSLLRSIERLTAEHARLRKAIEDHHDQHPGLKAERDLLRTIPSVGPGSADQLLCLLRSRRFDNARQAAALSGLVPVEHSSGTSIRGRPHLSKQGNPRLRAVLYMASVASLRHNPELRAIYDKLVAKGKAKMAALGALMRHIVHIAFGVLKHQQPYNPALVSKIS